MASKVTLHNQIELPSIDEFRLENILCKVVQAEKKQLSQSILHAKTQFQADLRQELRRSLGREQRIQYKNIEVEKKAQLVRKKMKSRRKRWAKLGPAGAAEPPSAGVGFGAAGEKTSSLPSEVASLQQVAGSISDGVLGLAARLNALDVCLGGTGVPDGAKYPMIHQMLSRGEAKRRSLSEEAAGAPDDLLESETRDVSSARQVEKLSRCKGAVRSGSEDSSGSVGLQDPSGSLGLEDPHSKSVVQDPHSKSVVQDPHPKSSGFDAPGVSPQRLKKPYEEGAISRSQQQSEAGPNAGQEECEAEEINSEIFESLIDEYNRKARLKSERRLGATGEPSSAKPMTRSRNPLRLLSAGISRQPHESVISEPMNACLLPSKSVATVGESPELSLHKKLRISALPLPSTRGQSCQCSQHGEDESQAKAAVPDGIAPSQSAGSAQEDKVAPSQSAGSAQEDKGDSTESPAKTRLSSFLSDYDAQFTEVSRSFDMDFDSSGINSDSDSARSMASSDSSESVFVGSIGDTNQYYDSLRRGMRKQSRVREASRSKLKEASPNPKHQPSHRTLQPKQSILKLQRRRPCPDPEALNAGMSPTRPSDPGTHDSVRTAPGCESGPATQDWLMDQPDPAKLHSTSRDGTFRPSQYTVSPRASFVAENSAVGEILRADPEAEPDPAEPEAINRLRNLLL